jgi:adenylate kinase
MDIILHGPPGAGKGTQSDNICEQLNIVAISTGDLIRAEIKGNTDLGQQIKGYSSVGKLVPDELVMTILGKRLEQEDVANGVLFDGFPRTANQATMLEDWLGTRGRTVNGVFSLEITDQESMFRCTYRLGCSDKVNANCNKDTHIFYHRPTVIARSKDETPIFACRFCDAPLKMRNDALPSKVQTRIDTYHEETAPLIDILANDFSYLVFKINGMSGIEEIKSNINNVINSNLK